VTDGVSTKETARRLGTTPPTVRALLENGELQAVKVPRGSRFAWLVNELSIASYLAQNGQFTGGRRVHKSRIASLEHELAAVRAAIGRAAAPVDLELETLQRERDDLRATVVTLQDVVARARTVADLHQQADAARAKVIEHLIAAVSAGEQADALRRAAVAELEEAVAAASRARHLGDLRT
jgi:excisionase family DNA binding protein